MIQLLNKKSAEDLLGSSDLTSTAKRRDEKMSPHHSENNIANHKKVMDKITLDLINNKNHEV